MAINSESLLRSRTTARMNNPRVASNKRSLDALAMNPPKLLF
jgi:hypothetical protein